MKFFLSFGLLLVLTSSAFAQQISAEACGCNENLEAIGTSPNCPQPGDFQCARKVLGVCRIQLENSQKEVERIRKQAKAHVRKARAARR